MSPSGPGQHLGLWRLGGGAAAPLPSVCGHDKETRLLLAASLHVRPILGPRQEALTSAAYTWVLRWGLGLLQPPCCLFGLSGPVSEVGLFAPIGTRNFIISRKKDPCEQFMVSLPLCACTAWCQIQMSLGGKKMKSRKKFFHVGMLKC